MNKRLEIRCLGAFSVTLAGTEVTGFESDKARALLAYLATEASQPHRRERLAGLLWPDFDDRAARTNLRRVLSNVRKVIGDRTADFPSLNITNQTVGLNVDNVWVDVLVFQKQITSDELAQIKEGVILYNGPLLDAFYIKASDTFEEWLTLTRNQLHRQMMEALGHIARASEKKRDFDQTAAAARHQLNLEPWHEPAHRRLMRVLARNGQRIEALNQYERCRSQLVQELGVMPEPSTIALYEQIRDGRLSTEKVADLGIKRSGNLPTPIRPLIGRGQELEELRQLLVDEKRRLITVLGAGGSGKTRLALEFGKNVADHYSDGVFFVDLAGHNNIEAIIPAIADALSFKFFEEQPPQEQLENYLRLKTSLLIIDNFEHLLGGSRLMVDLLQAAPNLQIITTSRQRLALQDEQLYPLDGLDFKTADSEAVQLFSQNAMLVQPDFDLSSDNQAAVYQICRFVEGMPLAILLAASWITILSPEEIAAELKKTTTASPGLDLLQTEWRDIPARQRSLRAVFNYSWHLLMPLEQAICAQLSLFRGGFTYQAAYDVTRASLPTLMGLVNRSLLIRREDGRFTMHELLRQFAAEKLAQSSDLHETTVANHTQYFSNLVNQQEKELKGEEQESALIKLEKENENIHLVWQWAIQQNEVEVIGKMLPGITLFFLWRHRYEEGAKWMVEALDQMANEKEFVAKLSAVKSRFQAQQQHYNDAQSSAQMAADLSPQNPFSHLQLGYTWMWIGDLEQSQHYFEVAYQGFQEMTDVWGEAEAMAGLAETANMLGNYDSAQPQFETSLSLYQKCGDWRGQAFVLERLSFVLRDRGQLIEAEQRVMAAIDIYNNIGDRVKIAEGSISLSWLLVYMGRFEEAYAAAEKGASVLNQAGRPIPLNLLGIINVELGRYAEAKTLLKRHVTRCRQVGDTVELALGLNVLASIEIVSRNFSEAQALLSESMPLLSEHGQQDRLAHAQAFWGYAARGKGDLDEAWRYFRLALQTAVEIEAIIPLLFGLPGIALLLANNGEVEKAAAVYSPLQVMPLIANGQLHHDLSGKELIALLPDLSLATQEETADLWAIAEKILAEFPNHEE